MPPPAAASGGERTITIGSLSKAVWGGLRIGWVRADPLLVRRLATARASLDMASPVFEQLVATKIFDEPRSDHGRAAGDDPAAPRCADCRARPGAHRTGATRFRQAACSWWTDPARTGQHQPLDPGERARRADHAGTPVRRPRACSSATSGSRSRSRPTSSSWPSRSWPISARPAPGAPPPPARPMSPERDPLARAPSGALVLGAIASVQFGSAIATKLFGAGRPQRRVLLRLLFASIVLLRGVAAETARPGATRARARGRLRGRASPR